MTEFEGGDGKISIIAWSRVEKKKKQSNAKKKLEKQIWVLELA